MSLKNILMRTLNQRNKFVNFAAIAVRLKHGEQSSEQKQQHRYYRNIIGTICISAVVINYAEKKDDKTSDEVVDAGDKIPGLPVYRADEVRKHDTKDSFWVTYKNGVYDMTSFLPEHPGGHQILNAGGLSIEPFWDVYGIHKTPKIFKLLESHRIGNLHDDDVVQHSDGDFWVQEPDRDKRLIVKTTKPFNAEIPPNLIMQNFDTPNEHFFVRNHMPVPELTAENHKLKIAIEDDKSNTYKEFDLATLLRTFPAGETRATLMCAGNRRSEMGKEQSHDTNQVKPVRGIDWQMGAISSALWSGVYLRDVLLFCGVDANDTAGKHVIFTGSDMDATGENFNTSIPLDQALNVNGKILLATHMNGKVLPKDHGYPIRVIVPGAPAVRSVKWLQSITISSSESNSHWHKGDYRSFNSSTTWETADFESAPPLYSLPVTSAICHPVDGDTCTVENGFIIVRGYAYSGGGAKIVRVDVTADGGGSWRQAQLELADPAPPAQHYAWTLWRAELPAPQGLTEMEIWVKATDSNFNTQPERFQNIWNIRGLLSNAYHKIKVNINH